MSTGRHLRKTGGALAANSAIRPGIVDALPTADTSNVGHTLILSTDNHLYVSDGTTWYDLGGDFVLKSGDTMTGALSVQGVTTLNSTGADVDTQIKGLTDDNLIYVDAGNDRVGIGTGTPNDKLDVVGHAIISGLTTAGTVRATGNVTPSSGAGVEMLYAGGEGYVFSYDRTGGVYKPLRLEGSTVYVNAGLNDQDTIINGDTVEVLRVDASADSVGIQKSAPTAWLHIGAGSTSQPPLKFSSGSLLTSAEAGSIEYLNNVLYGTPNINNRGVLATPHIISQTADYTGSNVNTAQKVFNASTNGAITLPASTSYLMEGVYHIHTTGTTSHTLSILFGGTATLTSIDYSVITPTAAPATEVGGTGTMYWFTAATAQVVSTAAATATHHTIIIKGIVRTNASGTFIPQYQWSAAPGVAGVTLRGSYLTLTPFGSNTDATVGSWS